jgi:prepilin peptidase CpaA
MTDTSRLASVMKALPIALPLLALLLLAAREDVRTRRIPNRLIALGLGTGLIARFLMDGGSGLLSAGAGALLAGALLFPGWLLGWTGAGDVKLMAVSGAWLGPHAGVMAVLFSLIAGGIAAVVVAARHGVLRQSLTSAATMGAWILTPHAARGPLLTTGVKFPFAVAILAGTAAALWVRP